MGKTDTIQDRRVDVYVESLERKERWVEAADEADDSLSKFVQRCVEYVLEQGGLDYDALGAESKRIQELEQQVDNLQEQVDQKQMVIEKLEADLSRHRSMMFQNDVTGVVREYDEELVRLLKDSERLSADDLLRRLDVDPMDTEVVEGIDSQLQQLESMGIVMSTPSGWIWKG